MQWTCICIILNTQCKIWTIGMVKKMKVSHSNSIYVKVYLFLFILLCGIQDIHAGPANKTIGIDVNKECTQEYHKIQKQIESSKKSTECDAAFNIYKENLRKCYKEKVGEMEIPFPQSSFEIASCYGDNDDPEKIKQIFEYSLTYPDWTMKGPVECSGHNMWAGVLETMNLLEKTPPKCDSLEELNKRLKSFRDTHNIALLAEIRGEEFGILVPKEGCPYPFEKFAKELKEKINAADLTITPLKLKDNKDNTNHFFAVTGFKDKPDSVLVLSFWSDHNQSQKDASMQDQDEDNDEDTNEDEKKKNETVKGNKVIKEGKVRDGDIADSAVKKSPCYHLVNHVYFNSKQDMLEEGFVPEDNP